MSDDRRILREYVKNVLREDDGAYGMTAADMAGDGYGMGMFSGGPSLYKIFVEPFVDVFKTTQAAAEDVSTRARAAGKVAFEAIATSLIPGLSSDYQKIFDKEHQQLLKIKEKYRDVFERTDKALSNEGGDFKLLAFLLDPARYISFKIARSAPEVALSAYETLAGESEHLRNFFNKLKIVSRTNGGKQKVTDAGVWSTNGPGYFEGLVREASEEQSPLSARLSDPKLLKAISDSPKVQAMQRDAKAVVNQAVSELLSKVKALKSARTLDDLARQVPNFDRSKLAALQKLPPNERKSIEDTVLQQTKKAATEFYAKTLEKQMQAAANSGIPESNPLLQGYKKVLGMIRSS